MSGEAKFDDAKGRMKEAAGDVSGDEDLQREGKADQVGASAKEKLHQAKEKGSDLVDKAKDAVHKDR